MDIDYMKSDSNLNLITSTLPTVIIVSLAEYESLTHLLNQALQENIGLNDLLRRKAPWEVNNQVTILK